jgi:putative ABC transport system permease protein
MRLLLDLRIAYGNVLQHRRRSLWLGCAMLAVTVLSLLMLAASAGVRANMLVASTTLLSGHVNIGGVFKASRGQSAALVSNYQALVPVLRRLGLAASTVSRGRGWAKLVSERAAQQLNIMGVDMANEAALRRTLSIRTGSLEALATPATVLLFESQARALDVAVGDPVTLTGITPRGVNNAVDLTVVAIARDLGFVSKFVAFVPAESLRSLLALRPDTTGVMQIHLPEHDVPRAALIADRLRSELIEAGYEVVEASPLPYWQKTNNARGEGWVGQRLDVTTWQDEIQPVAWTLQIVDGLTFVMTAVLLITVVMGVMSTMWVAVRERRREIATLRAIGMQQTQVLRVFVLEAVLLGLLSTMLGSLVGTALIAILNTAQIHVPASVQFLLMSDVLTFSTTLEATSKPAAMVVVVAGLSALWPAYRASHIRPERVMQHSA